MTTDNCTCSSIPAKDRPFACCTACLDASMNRSADRLDAAEAFARLGLDASAVLCRTPRVVHAVALMLPAEVKA